MIVKTITHKWITSFLIVFLSFVPVCLFLFPIFNSGDDVFLLYTLAGGYGEAPTNLLHYNHVWHPLLGWVMKSLFESIPFVNWYTVLLMGLQFVSSIIFLFYLFRIFRFGTALILYLIFFYFIELSLFLY